MRPGVSVDSELWASQACSTRRDEGNTLETVDEVEHLILRDLGVLFAQAEGIHGGR